MQSKNATGNLINRYKAVLKKCNLINVFGSFMLASMLASPVMFNTAFAAENNSNTPILGMDATNGSYQAPTASGQVTPSDDKNLVNNGTIDGGVNYTVGNNDLKAAMFGYDSTSATSYSFTNNGTLTAKTINSDANIFRLYGMYAKSDSAHTFINSAGSTMNIIASTSDKTDDANHVNIYPQYIYVMHAEGSGSHALTNDGTINMDIDSGKAIASNKSAYAYINDIRALSAENGFAYSLANNGAITIDMQTAGAEASGAVEAYIGNVRGIYAKTAQSGDSSMANNANAQIKINAISRNVHSSGAVAIAYISQIFGIEANGFMVDGNFTVTNDTNALLEIVAKAGNATAGDNANSSISTIYGIYVSDDKDVHTVENKGNITLNLTAGTATSTNTIANAIISGSGISANGDTIKINSTGAIDIIARGGTALSGTANEPYNYHDARIELNGILASSSSNNTIENSGTISIHATGGTATRGGTASQVTANVNLVGVNIDGGTGRFNNSGTIKLTAIGGTATNNGTGGINSDALAYGVYVNNTTSALLTNTSIIDVSATAKQTGASARAYEAYSNSDVTVDTWATTLRTWSANDTVFALENGKSINFANSTEGATLILRPGTAGQGFVSGKEYELANMVAIQDASGNFQLHDEFDGTIIKGLIAEVKTEVDFITASLNTSDPNKPTVSLTLAENNLPANEIVAANLSANVAHLNGLSKVVKDAVAKIYSLSLFDTVAMHEVDQAGLAAGSSVSIPKWTVFATTYGTYTDNNKYDFNADSFGLTSGITYNFSEKFALGGHLNIDITDSKSDNLQNDAFSLAFGGHAHYFINPKWYVNGNATFSFGSNDADYTQSIGKASDSFNSFGLILGAHTGYVLELNKNNIIVPEIGLSYTYSSQEDYSFNFAAPHDSYNVKYDDMAYSNLYADLSLTWQGKYATSFGMISPSVGVGIRQALTNSDVDASYVFGGTDRNLTVSSDDTSFLVDAGLDFTKGAFTIGAKYSGEFGDEQKSHSGSLNFIYKF